MAREELDRELDALWRRLRSPEGMEEAREGPAPASPARQRLEAEAEELRGMLEARERTIEDLSNRLKAAEGEATRARGAAENEQDALLDQMTGLSAMLDEARAALLEARDEQQRLLWDQKKDFEAKLAARAAAEAEAFERLSSQSEAKIEALEREKERLARVEAYWKGREARWLEKERRLQERLKGLEESLRELRKEKEAAAAEGARGSLEIARLREALEAHKRSSAEAEELRGRISELQASAEEERRRWKELWDREQAAREVQRRDLELWEQRLRRDLPPPIGPGPASAPPPRRAMPPVPRGLARWILGLLAAGAAAWAALRFAAVPHFFLKDEASLRLDRPTAVAAFGGRLWAAQWDGELAEFSAASPGREERRFKPEGAAHPVALTVVDGALWSLDASDGAVRRHDPREPARAAEQFKLGAERAPSLIAFDGRRLWSYDAAGRTFWSQTPSGGEARAYAAPEDLRPSAAGWSRGSLWVFDARSGELWRLEPAGGRLVERSRSLVPGEPSAAFVAGDTLWTLSAAAGERCVLRKYRIWP